METKSYSLDASIYSNEAILLTLTEMADVITGNVVTSRENGSVVVSIFVKDDKLFDDVLEFTFMQRLNQNELRVRLRKSFEPIENEIVHRAFGKGE